MPRVEDSGLEARAHAWMDEHPEAMALFERLALQAVKAKRRFGIGLLTERVRWEAKVSRWVDGFKINNNHRAYIARELVRRYPSLSAWLELRTVRG